MMRPLAECTLYTFIDSAYLRGRKVEEVAFQLCRGGSDLIQLRAKDWPCERVRAVAESILPILRDHGVGLVINDHLDLADQLEADICHLGQEDFFEAGWTHVSHIPRKGTVRIGLSTHSPDQAQRAISAGADYVAIGPVFQTGTKPTAIPVTLEYVRWAASHVEVPWFAIGGINLETVDSVLNAGATRICVVSAILNHKNITAACGEFRVRLQSRN